MYQEDFLLRQIRQLVQAVADIHDEEAAELDQFDDALHRTLGLRIELLDRLPTRAILDLIERGDAHDPQRRELVAAALHALGRGESAVHARRRAKALAIRTTT